MPNLNISLKSVWIFMGWPIVICTGTFLSHIFSPPFANLVHFLTNSCCKLYCIFPETHTNFSSKTAKFVKIFWFFQYFTCNQLKCNNALCIACVFFIINPNFRLMAFSLIIHFQLWWKITISKFPFIPMPDALDTVFFYG